MNFELIKDVRGSFCDLFNVVSQYLSGETEENHENPMRVAGPYGSIPRGIMQIRVHTFLFDFICFSKSGRRN